MVQHSFIGGPMNDVRRGLREPSLAKRLWDLDWTRVMPWTFDEVIVEYGSYEDALPFIQKHYPEIFGTSPGEARFLPQPLTEAKLRFGKEMDVFLLRDSNRIVGVIMAHPSDWTTYYLRSAAFLPDHRHRHIGRTFLENICAPLKAVGVERIEAECSPTNMTMVRLLTHQGYVLTSTTSSERWGFVARYTQFLDEEAETIFRRQHCAMPCERSSTLRKESQS